MTVDKLLTRFEYKYVELNNLLKDVLELHDKCKLQFRKDTSKLLHDRNYSEWIKNIYISNELDKNLIEDISAILDLSSPSLLIGKQKYSNYENIRNSIIILKQEIYIYYKCLKRNSQLNICSISEISLSIEYFKKQIKYCNYYLIYLTHNMDKNINSNNFILFTNGFNYLIKNLCTLENYPSKKSFDKKEKLFLIKKDLYIYLVYCIIPIFLAIFLICK